MSHDESNEESRDGKNEGSYWSGGVFPESVGKVYFGILEKAFDDGNRVNGGYERDLHYDQNGNENPDNYFLSLYRYSRHFGG